MFKRELTNLEERLYDFLDFADSILDCNISQKSWEKLREAMKHCKEEFDSISELFSDDRDPMPFQVTRIIPFQELKARRLLTKARRSREVLQETVTVQARDPREAYSITENAISVDY